MWSTSWTAKFMQFFLNKVKQIEQTAGNRGMTGTIGF